MVYIDFWSHICLDYNTLYMQGKLVNNEQVCLKTISLFSLYWCVYLGHKFYLMLCFFKKVFFHGLTVVICFWYTLYVDL